MADAGQLVFVLAGAPGNVERVKPYTTGVYVGWSLSPILPLLTPILGWDGA